MLDFIFSQNHEVFRPRDGFPMGKEFSCSDDNRGCDMVNGSEDQPRECVAKEARNLLATPEKPSGKAIRRIPIYLNIPRFKTMITNDI